MAIERVSESTGLLLTTVQASTLISSPNIKPRAPLISNTPIVVYHVILGIPKYCGCGGGASY